MIIEDGKEYRNTYVPKVIKDGERHYWLSTFTTSILFNNPSITSDRLELILYKVNCDHCQPKLSKQDIHSIVNWSYKNHTEQKLFVRTKKKKIWINPDKKLDTSQKRKIVGQESGKLRRKRTLNELIKVYKQLSIDNQKVTQKLLEQYSSVKIRTIKKYWKEILEKVYFIK